MRRSITACLLAAGLAGAAVYLSAQAPATAEPFKLGTFEQQGRMFIGLVLRDSIVADLSAANAALERENPGWPKVSMPREMKALIAGYEVGGLKQRLAQIATATAGAGAGSGRPAYVHEVKALKVRPPIMYPDTILNAAVNYVEHAAEMQGRPGQPPAAASSAAPPQSVPGLWERQPGDTRHNPYLFIKPRVAVIGEGDAIRIPPGRERVDWECELNAVIGKTASYVPVNRAIDYIFGYTLQNDVSDRGGRADGRHGSDWLIGKGHDTFAPVGPFIVPKEFVKDAQKLAIKFTLNGQVMQDSNTARMTHTVIEMVSFASNILTLRPGDLISTGSPAGVGTARATPIYMKPGDVSVCSIEGIGTLTNPVTAAAPAATSNGR